MTTEDRFKLTHPSELPLRNMLQNLTAQFPSMKPLTYAEKKVDPQS